MAKRKQAWNDITRRQGNPNKGLESRRISTSSDRSERSTRECRGGDGKGLQLTATVWEGMQGGMAEHAAEEGSAQTGLS